MADVTGDGFEDIVQGDHVESGPGLLAEGGGEVRLWRGAERGPETEARSIIAEKSRVVPGDDELEDSFGYAVNAGDLDGDGYADIVVGAPGENEGAGAVTVIRGARNGIALTSPPDSRGRGRESRARRSSMRGSARRWPSCGSQGTIDPTSWSASSGLDA